MNGDASYRQYLQYHANNHPSAAKRAEAQALLNVVGDDQRINGNFLTGRREGGFLGIGSHLQEQRSNGYNASTVNRSVNPWWQNSTRITAGGTVKTRAKAILVIRTSTSATTAEVVAEATMAEVTVLVLLS